MVFLVVQVGGDGWVSWPVKGGGLGKEGGELKVCVRGVDSRKGVCVG